MGPVKTTAKAKLLMQCSVLGRSIYELMMRRILGFCVLHTGGLPAL